MDGAATWNYEPLSLQASTSVHSIPLIGICGKIGAGKDTVGEIFTTQYNYIRKAFATRVKSVTAALLDIPADCLYTHEGKNRVDSVFQMSYGQILQHIGQGYRELFVPDIWVRLLFRDFTPDARWVITDVRYDNEIAEIRQRGGIIIQVVGDPLGLQSRDMRNKDHASECGITLPPDYVIYNDSTIDALIPQIQNILNNLS